ncbi:MAG: 3-oxo-tetronate kinase [Pseudomonadota bacterium]
MLLGCIADDITGATDLALMLSRSGMRTIQVMGVPDEGVPFDDYDAVVVALKSRTIAPDDAIAMSCASLDALQANGARQIFFKYCSTFDSTPDGNIGPVADALFDRLGGGVAIVCPAFPANARSIYQGHLFVGDMLLSDSPMKDHPLTPMTDANLVRVMAAQCRRPVGVVPHATVAAGADAVRAAFANLAQNNGAYAVVDAIDDGDLITIRKAVADHALLTGGSGIAMGLADNFIAAGLMERTDPATTIAARSGRAVVLAGSCSTATRGQIGTAMESGAPALRIDPADVVTGKQTADAVARWVIDQPSAAAPIVYSSDDPARVAEVQAAPGRNETGAAIEHLLSDVAQQLAEAGFTRTIVAGGETSGAVADGLGVRAIEIGPEIDPGVPWVRSLDDRKLTLAFKSGNFGAPDFFTKAFALLRDADADAV